MKNKGLAIVLAFFLGGFGAHKFYLGETRTGILFLLFFWTFIPTFISLIDVLLLLTMSDASFNEKYNSNH